jgi:hypothetical protein
MQGYKKFHKKFELPIIENHVPKIIKRKLDVSPYNRAIRMHSSTSCVDFDTEHINNYQKFENKKNRNLSQESILNYKSN